MDDEDEMKRLRQSKLYQGTRTGWNQSNDNPRRDAENDQESEEDMDSESDQPQRVITAEVAKEFPLFNNPPQKQKGDDKAGSKRKRDKKFYEKSEFRKAGESESSEEDDLKQFEPKITDTELIKRQRYVDHNQGIAFMDDENKESEEILNLLTTQQKKQKLKEKLLNQNQLSTDLIEANVNEHVIPVQFGKTKTTLGNKEKFKLFSRVKRDVVEVEHSNLIKRHDIDVDEDEELIGPPIPKDILFSKDEPANTMKEEAKAEKQKEEDIAKPDEQVYNEKHSTSSVHEEFNDIDQILLDNNIPISHETI